MSSSAGAVALGYLFGVLLVIVIPLAIGIVLVVKGNRERRAAQEQLAWYQQSQQGYGQPPQGYGQAPGGAPGQMYNPQQPAGYGAPPLNPKAGGGKRLGGWILIGIGCLFVLAQCANVASQVG